jgi:hypothetical protein
MRIFRIIVFNVRTVSIFGFVDIFCQLLSVEKIQHSLRGDKRLQDGICLLKRKEYEIMKLGNKNP